TSFKRKLALRAERRSERQLSTLNHCTYEELEAAVPLKEGLPGFSANGTLLPALPGAAACVLLPAPPENLARAVEPAQPWPSLPVLEILRGLSIRRRGGANSSRLQLFTVLES